ncbi:glutaredoxin family protein [Teredinibacter sp. KSP-S5-2]|uniref:glutaredoxin family protein n=1 Tax=Teredinibacter sp. KSP-S5-2 TaxID=3034506 RepID=UPI002934752C|nr:glutaredoxin family protein [Teredinibacter sp. KSP-S5-2]WNO10230.1 glutaredoxin family protein [Teredinibacter sp. KSP-S5-2]
MFKKVLVIAAALLIFQYWGSINSLLNPPPDFAAAHNGKVILYSTAWCGYCAKARKLLKDNGIDYFEYDIEKSQEGKRQYKALGGSGIPVLLIKGEVIKGYNPNRILKLAKQS